MGRRASARDQNAGERMNQQNAQRDRCSHSDQQQSKFVHLSVILLIGYRVAPEKAEQQINFE